jgi:hypothetical protein
MLRRTVVICLLFAFTTETMAQLTNYQVLFGLTTQAPQQIIWRQWQQQGQYWYLLVDPQTLETTVATLPPGSVRAQAWPALLAKISQTPYGQAMRTEQQRSGSLQDAGIKRASSTQQGFSLTIDLCPSTKPLTRSVFEALIRAFEKAEKPVPVTITVTGVWMANHQADLDYLKGLVGRGDLAITWVNHSFHHRFDPLRPLAVNFLLEPKTNLRNEVLLNEQAMLQNGITPAIFFRFPGLVSDRTTFDEVLAFGLLPIGSDAWLAKGQPVRPGSFVLIHANGNEPLGIADFIRLIRQKAPAIRNKTWLLYELPSSLAGIAKP